MLENLKEIINQQKKNQVFIIQNFVITTVYQSQREKKHLARI